MNRLKYIIRGTLLLLTVLLLIYSYRKSGDTVLQVAKYKLEVLRSIKSDSSFTEHKVDSLVRQTAKFSEQVIDDLESKREGGYYLMGAIGLLVVAELGFFILERRRIIKQKIQN